MDDDTLVLGIDSSTQSTKTVLVRAADGKVVDERSASHPDGTEVDPRAWLEALDSTVGPLRERASAIGVAGQQHGLVGLGADGEPVREALLWNDTRSAKAAQDLVAELGGAQACADATGSVLVASYTSTKLRWVRDHEPQNAERIRTVLLPHDYLTWHLAGRPDQAYTDRGDASGTGYFDTRNGRWREDLAQAALGHEVALPTVATPNQVIAEHDGLAVSAGTGDNMGAALGLGLVAGDVALSIGTSGVASAVSDTPTADGTGLVSGFADATGRFLPLACTINAARILAMTARLLDVDFAGLDELALAAPAGAHGLTLLPYLDGERTPNIPEAVGTLTGMTSRTSREDIARAAVEALLCSLADAVDYLAAATGDRAKRLVLIGGGARSLAVRKLAPAVIGVPVSVPADAQYVALGAARQAAWAFSGADDPPQWDLPDEQTYDAAVDTAVREPYAALRAKLYG